jgi:hypothetical protein
VAIGVYFHPESMSADKYDAIMEKLKAAGAADPPGRLHHVAFGPKDNLMVFDVFDSQENFDAFGGTLMPILAEMGVDPGQPMIEQIHNTVVAK